MRELKKKADQLRAENEDLKRQKVGQKAETEKRVSDLQSSHAQATDKLRKAEKELKTENDVLKQKLKDCAERVKDLEIENAVLKKGLNSSFPKGETKDHIKSLFDEYVREVEKSLNSIGGLSSTEIKDLVKEEMRELTDYFQKSIQPKS